MDIKDIIIKKLGMDSYIKGKNYKGTIQFYDQDVSGNLGYYRFRVQSEHNPYRYYYVTIAISKNELVGYSCNCPQCSGMRTCKHIAASLLQYEEEIFDFHHKKELRVSQSILEYFSNGASQTGGIKEKLNLEVEFEFDNGRILAYLLIGLKKLYVIKTERKLQDFIEAYQQNDTYQFGVGFTYDAKIHYFSDEDKQIIDFMSEYETNNVGYGYGYGYYSQRYNNPFELNMREFKELLKLLGNRSFKIRDYGIIKEVKNEFPIELNLEYNDNKYELLLHNLKNYKILDSECKFIAHSNTLYMVPETMRHLLIMCINNSVDKLIFEKENLELFKKGLLPKIKNNVVVSDKIDDIKILGKPDISLYFDIEKDKITCKIELDYQGHIIHYFEDTNILRDEEVEQEVIDDLNSFHFNIEKPTITLKELDDIGYFLSEGLTELSEKYKIYTSKKIDNMQIIKKSSVNSNFSIGQDAIMSYKFAIDNVDSKELDAILKSIKTKKKYYKLKNGNLINLEENKELNELSDMIQELEIDSKNLENGEVEIPKYRAFYIDSLKKNKYKNIKTDYSFDTFIQNLLSYKNAQVDLDKQEQQILRDYQKEGVQWLYTLYKCDLGGILADEMGLGKSLQAICFIKQVLKEKKNAKIMIVCPTSLVYNWKKEFDKFASELKYTTVSETKQRRLEIINHFDDYNIFITSYGLIRNDNDEYENKNFEVCIIDEAQTIKNYQAGMTKEVKKIKARTKIALTGTPLENSIVELWSIFDFIMPGYLNSINKFKEKYGIKDIDEESLETLKTLNTQIQPFILRRKKKDVIKDLPDKIENNIYLELPDIQKALYIKTLKDTQEKMDELLAESGYSKTRFEILKLLTRLRQICIDPHILFENYQGESIKMEKLLEMVQSYIQDGHKILIFSSFKTVIHNVQKMLDKENISNYVITGDVKGKERTQLVDKFNNDDTSCFLITIKAGGTGLNLTSADIVIHLDIWWNPQVENQATDRAHRIGQKNKVTAVKLITNGTIEERIIELQNKKKILSDNLIEGKDDSEVISNITEEEMRKLLYYGEDED